MHLAVRLPDGARRAVYEQVLTRHGIVHWCDGRTALESVVGEGATVAMLQPGDADDRDTLDMVVGLRQKYPAVLLIVSYDPAGEDWRLVVHAAHLCRLGGVVADEPTLVVFGASLVLI